MASFLPVEKRAQKNDLLSFCHDCGLSKFRIIKFIRRTE
jgi:hypothetical protein